MELTLDRVELWLLGVAFGVSAIPLLRANGSRPFIAALLTMGALWAWTVWDGFHELQTDAEHARNIIAGVTLSGVVPWTLWRNRGHE